MWYTQYAPIICIAIVLLVLFIVWVFWGGKEYEFVGLGPLDPATCGEYTGSIYEWGVVYEEEEPEAPKIPAKPQKQEVAIEIDSVCYSEPESPTPNNVSFIQSTLDEVVEEFHGALEVFNGAIKDDYLFPDTSEAEENQPQPQLYQPQLYQPKQRQSHRFVSRGERICCETLERMFGVPFTNQRPDWLRNPETGRNLELDCYNEELKIAVEYNGAQHYQWPNFTGQSKAEFESQLRRDAFKSKMCEKRGVYLLIVPYTIPYAEIASYVTNKLEPTLGVNRLP